MRGPPAIVADNPDSRRSHTYQRNQAQFEAPHPCPAAVRPLAPHARFKRGSPYRIAYGLLRYRFAAELAREHGLNPVAEALRLNYYALKRRLGPPPAAAAAVDVQRPGPAFLELEVGQGSRAALTTTERRCQDPSGRGRQQPGPTSSRTP